jgi:hypothetical protein
LTTWTSHERALSAPQTSTARMAKSAQTARQIVPASRVKNLTRSR